MIEAGQGLVLTLKWPNRVMRGRRIDPNWTQLFAYDREPVAGMGVVRGVGEVKFMGSFQT